MVGLGLRLRLGLGLGPVRWSGLRLGLMGSRLGLGLGFGLEDLIGMVVTQNIQFKMSVCGKKDSSCSKKDGTVPSCGTWLRGC